MVESVGADMGGDKPEGGAGLGDSQGPGIPASKSPPANRSRAARKSASSQSQPAGQVRPPPTWQTSYGSQSSRTTFLLELGVGGVELQFYPNCSSITIAVLSLLQFFPY